MFFKQHFLSSSFFNHIKNVAGLQIDLYGSYPFLYRVWGRPGAPAAPRRPRLCIVHLGRTPLFFAGSSKPSKLQQLRDQGRCRQTSSHRAGTEAHHRDKVPSVPAPCSGNVPSFYCDLSKIETKD